MESHAHTYEGNAVMASSNRKKNDPEEVEESHGFIIEKPNLNGDWLNFSILTILYVIQGVPIGLVAGFSVILQSKKTVTFGDQVSNYSIIKRTYLDINETRKHFFVKPRWTISSHCLFSFKY